MNKYLPLSPMSFRFAFAVWTVFYAVIFIGSRWKDVQDNAGAYRDLRPVKQLMRDRVDAQRKIVSAISLYDEIATEAESEKERLRSMLGSSHNEYYHIFKAVHADKLSVNKLDKLRAAYTVWERAYSLGTKRVYLRSWLDERRREDLLGELDTAISDVKYSTKMSSVTNEKNIEQIWKRLDKKRFGDVDVSDISKSALDASQREAIRWLER